MTPIKECTNIPSIAAAFAWGYYDDGDVDVDDGGIPIVSYTGRFRPKQVPFSNC